VTNGRFNFSGSVTGRPRLRRIGTDSTNVSSLGEEIKRTTDVRQTRVENRDDDNGREAGSTAVKHESEDRGGLQEGAESQLKQRE